jgi:hypothetical protein
MSQDGLYDFYVDQNCGPQPDEPETEAEQIASEANRRVVRGQQLTRILLANLRGDPQ